MCGKEIDLVFGVLAEKQYVTKYRSFINMLKAH